MKTTVRGKFTVKGTPQAPDELSTLVGAGRMKFEKSFAGSLQATSIVSMMGMMDQKLVSGGYVAIERVTGELAGKRGQFSLQHSSVMDRGKPSQKIQVIPDSGTEALRGLKGEMTIEIAPG